MIRLLFAYANIQGLDTMRHAQAQNCGLREKDRIARETRNTLKDFSHHGDLQPNKHLQVEGTPSKRFS
jgi:hypothetical protein